jgi:hypothetical protein
MRHLESYRKSGIGWDVYRDKINNDLLDKWGRVVNKCRQNGFIAPYVYQNILHWKQIMTKKTSTNDKCVVCSMTEQKGNCVGLMIFKGDSKIFVPCWY